MPSVIQVARTQASPLDITAATNAYLAQIPPTRTARSAAYCEGGHWLIFGTFLRSRRRLCCWNLRGPTQARTVRARHSFQTGAYVCVLAAMRFLPQFSFPLTVYEDYFREHKYGLATQTLAPGVDQIKGSWCGRVRSDLVRLRSACPAPARPNLWIMGVLGT